MITALILGSIAMLVLLWWFFIEPLRDSYHRISMISDDIRNAELRINRLELATRDQEDRFGNHLNQHGMRIYNLEHYTGCETEPPESQSEKNDRGHLIEFNAPQRANMER